MALSLRFIGLIEDVARGIVEAQRPIRIVRALTWDDSVRRRFFADAARELPRPEYRVRRDWSETLDDFSRLRARVPGDNEVERLLRRTCDSWAEGAQLLAAVGTREFHRRSVDCYGQPGSVSSDGKSTNLDLARHFDKVIEAYQGAVAAAPEALLSDTQAQSALLGRLSAVFCDDHIRCEVADELTAQAVASADTVKVKRGATFTAREIEQLVAHEGYVHLGTTLNGRRQQPLSFLSRGAPRTTCTQEGLAIFAEFTSQTIELDRLRRLSDRILAIKMSEDGADFLELFRFFSERGHPAEAAYDCARRVMRGGVITGGAPFTKDVVYLDGLLHVANFLRVAVMRGRTDYVRTLFAGKMAVEDVPLMAVLARQGVAVEARYLPPWAEDLRFLTAHLGFSAFFAATDLGASGEYYERLIERSESVAAD